MRDVREIKIKPKKIQILPKTDNFCYNFAENAQILRLFEATTSRIYGSATPNRSKAAAAAAAVKCDVA